MSYVTGAHNFKTGLQLRQCKRYVNEGASRCIFRNGSPTQLTMAAYPLTYRASMQAQLVRMRRINGRSAASR